MVGYAADCGARIAAAAAEELEQLAALSPRTRAILP
jgi:hypothetical protein